MINGKELANNIIDMYCDRFGTDDCCCMLASIGLREQELKELDFENSDIKQAKDLGYLGE